MKIIITGASGLVGTALVAYLKAQGHEVHPVVRSTEPLGKEVIRWDPKRGFIDYREILDVDVVINLAGENIGEGRWTDKKKSEILFSRVNSTNFLSQIIGSLETKPRLFINASAVGFYGNQGNSILTEKSPKGTGFLADVCSQWEASTEYAKRAGIRTVMLRFGMVIAPDGGALKSMLPPFKWGLGGKIGSGKQWWSWVAIEDLCRAIEFTITNNDLEGPINVVSPFPVTNEQFTKALGEALGKPTFFPLPAFMARIILGQMADEMILASQRVEPEKLIKAGFTFDKPKIEQALKSALKK